MRAAIPGAPYTIGPGTAYEKQSKTEQTLDIHGNVTQSKIYDYGNLVTPARTYTHTYLTDSAYTSRHIWNRLVSSTVNGTTLVTNTYDGTPLANRDYLGEHDPGYGTSFTVRGNLTHQVTPGAIRNTAYDIGGAPTAVDDGYGHQLSVAESTVTNYAAPDAVTPQGNNNLTTSYTYTPALNVASVTQPNNAVSSTTYDAYARPSQSTSPHGAVTTYTYSGNLITATTGARIERTTLDGLGRTIKTEAGDSSGMKTATSTEYDSCACSPAGKVKRVSMPYLPASGPSAWTTYVYDALGRTLTATAPDSSVTTYLYQGNATTITDPAGKWKKYTTDAMGNLIQVTEPAPEGGTHETYYTYNIHNQLTGVSMPRGAATQTRTFNKNGVFIPNKICGK